ncbi:MAG: glutamate--cysteine ligase [Eggerthellaceae bacterium]|nr:glutamate--cysteine ligase [Eggerthellaceae bacterium]
MQANIEAITNYFKSGIKDAKDPVRLGMELEHILVTEHMEAVPYSDEHGSRWLLEQFLEDLPEATYGEEGALIGASGPGAALTLEPAAQFEISAGPYEYANEVRPELERFERKAAALLNPHGQRLITLGYHPTARVDDLELIPKRRYQYMDDHFQAIGRYGRCMMRGSAATQISIDYYSEKDCLRKMRIASALAPAFALLCDNSPVFEGEIRTHQLVRTKIWRECDPARCGLVPGIMEPDFSFEKYAAYVLGTPAIFGIDENGKPFATEQTFGELYQNHDMQVADVEHALSLFFNDVRLKTYIEIRSADSMPTPFVAAYVALIKGLFYSSESLDALDETIGSATQEDVEQAKTDLMDAGYDALLYGIPAGEFIDNLFDLARKALSATEASCLAPLAQLAASRKTLATMGERKAR